MAFSDPVNTSSSGSRLVDGLLWGMHWSDGSRATTSLAVYIAGTNTSEFFDFGGDAVRAITSSDETAAWRASMAMIEAACNVDFVEVGSAGAADIIVAAAPVRFVGGLGVAVPPGEDRGPLANHQGAAIVSRDSYVSDDYSSLDVGGFDFISFIHELGHAIGLKHPHDRGGGDFPRFPGVGSDSDLGDFDLNQGINTVMTYNDGYPAGPLGPQNEARVPSYGWNTLMALDIAALQHLYGANASHRTGNDTYTLPSANAPGTYFGTIWDAGGIDAIVAGGDAGCTINLNSASLGVAADGGGAVSSHARVLGGFTIAQGTVIENATGGAGGDSLIGNAADNELDGRGGNDRLNGGAGNDALTGGAGRDRLTGGGGDDTFRFLQSSDSFGAGADRITDFGLGGDVIDLAAIDGNSGGGDSFDFIGTDRFSGEAGELRYAFNANVSATVVLGDIDGDGRADFRLLITGQAALDADHFLL